MIHDHDFPARATGLRLLFAIVSATGGIGRQLLEQALAAGHDVTAGLASADPAALRPAVEGADAVLSGLGAWPTQCPG